MKSLFGKQKMLLILFLANSFLLFGHTKSDTLIIANYIVKRGYIISYQEFKNGIADPASYITIFTSEDSVFSVSDGKVKAFFKVDQSEFMMIETTDSLFVYGGINFNSLKQFDKINKGQFLGLISKSNNSDRSIVFSLCSKEGTNCLNYIDLFEHLKKYKK